MPDSAKPKRSARPSRRLPSAAPRQAPLVAIVGRPNVGKSTLFNRLAGQRLAIVEDVPGVTRDRQYATSDAIGRPFVLVDTGGFDPDTDDPLRGGIARHVQAAVAECDIIIAVLDGRAEPVAADHHVVHWLRQSPKPVIWVANKIDSPKQIPAAMNLYALGIDSVLPLSAMHGVGTGDLEEALAALLPQPETVAAPGDAPAAPDGSAEAALLPTVAIVGRPNAGKSSLVNALLGAEQQLVDDKPGTTVDSIDTVIERYGRRLVLVDTAGLRRKRAVGAGTERLAVSGAIRTMERSRAVLLLIDAKAGVAEQDAKIAGLAVERGCALLIGLNKVDLLSPREQKACIAQCQRIFAFAPWAPVLLLSAIQGQGLRKLVGTLTHALTAHSKRISTAQANRFFEEVVQTHPPPTTGGSRPVRIYYVTQASTAPPTFVAMTNASASVHFSYQRFIINQLRQRFDFFATPVRVFYRAKRRRDKSSD